NNNDVFAAFRTHRMQNDIAALMTDREGNLKSFAQFAKEAIQYTDHHNRRWLRTEYDTAVVRAHNAADWQQFEAEKDILPNLEWIRSTSANPGEDHRPFWGTVLPIDHPFWNQHKPVDRWNCKCSLRNTDKEPTQIPTGGVKDMPARGLENNPGQDGQLFSDKHAYFPASCGTCPFVGNKLSALYATLAGKQKNCYRCKKANKAIEQHITTNAKQEYDAYNPDAYKKIYFCKETGGYVVTENERLVSAKVNKQESAKYAKEKAMCITFAKAGNKIVHLGEVARISSADVLCNGIKADLKRTDSYQNIVKYSKHATRQQGAKIVLFQFDKWDAKFAKEVKNLIGEKVHGKYFITGKEDKIYEF
ncbi:MAG: phage minor head protein, partial [Bacteroidales bacterium]